MIAACLGSASFTACAHSGAGSLPSINAPETASSLGPNDAAKAYRVLYSFGQHGKSDDGGGPRGALAVVRGTLYGTTGYGGTTNQQCSLGCGTVFRVSMTGRESVIYRFTGGIDGELPAAGLIFKNGLIGTTSGGGNESACPSGCGTVFRLSTNGKSEKVLHAFTGPNDGADPVAGLIAIGATLYGTTEFGGTRTRLCTSGCGTVFSITAAGSERVIYRFKGGKDGAFPIGALDAFDGKLYGTTQYGGVRTAFCATGCGTIFRMTTGGVKSPLYNFRYSPASPDGAYPAAGLVALDGKLYGTTIGGGTYADGTVFDVNPASGAERVLHAFQCCGSNGDGQYPVAALIAANATLYGTTRNGGTGGHGTIFSLRRSGSESVLHAFSGKPDGATPQAQLTLLAGALFGVTTDGGSGSQGTVFRLVP